MLGQLVQNTWREKERRDKKRANHQVQRRAAASCENADHVAERVITKNMILISLTPPPPPIILLGSHKNESKSHSRRRTHSMYIESGK